MSGDKTSSSWAKVSGAALDFGSEETVKPKAKPKDPEANARYQEDYYQRNKDTLSDEAKRRWKDNKDGYRDRGLERAKAKRANQRSKKAASVHEARKKKFVPGLLCTECDWVDEGTKIPAKCPECKAKDAVVEVYLQDSGDEWTVIKTRKPRRVEVNGKPTWVYSSGAMGLKCSKAPSTMRTWIEERVVPGYTYKASGRYWFSMEFMEAVAEAVRKVLYLDGRGKLDILRRYVGSELEDQGIGFIPFPTR